MCSVGGSQTPQVLLSSQLDWGLRTMIFCALSEEDSHNKPPPHHWQMLMPMYLNRLSVHSAVGFGLDWESVYYVPSY